MPPFRIRLFGRLQIEHGDTLVTPLESSRAASLLAYLLLQSTLPARLAYIALDGTPRVVPLQFHWTGEELVVNSWPDDPKVAALRAHPQVAVTIDSNEPPFRVLQMRGTADVTLVDGVSEELNAAAKRYLGPAAGQEWAATVMRLSPQSARIAIRPAWADVLDFTTSLPGCQAGWPGGLLDPRDAACRGCRRPLRRREPNEGHAWCEVAPGVSNEIETTSRYLQALGKDRCRVAGCPGPQAQDIRRWSTEGIRGKMRHHPSLQ